MREEIAELRVLVADAWTLRNWLVWSLASAVLLGARIRLWLLENGWLHREWWRNIPANIVLGAVALAIAGGLGWLMVMALT